MRIVFLRTFVPEEHKIDRLGQLCAASLVDAKWVNPADNMEATAAFTGPVIFIPPASTRIDQRSSGATRAKSSSRKSTEDKRRPAQQRSGRPNHALSACLALRFDPSV
jgi:hypothetical protein